VVLAGGGRAHAGSARMPQPRLVGGREGGEEGREEGTVEEMSEKLRVK